MNRYSAKIIDHFMNPRYLGELPRADAIAEAANRCCGDRIRLFVRLRGRRIVESSFVAYGCAVALAVGSLLAEAIRGRDLEELQKLDEEWVAQLAGGLAPAQRHCVTLGHDVLHALADNAKGEHP